MDIISYFDFPDLKEQLKTEKNASKSENVETATTLLENQWQMNLLACSFANQKQNVTGSHFSRAQVTVNCWRLAPLWIQNFALIVSLVNESVFLTIQQCAGLKVNVKELWITLQNRLQLRIALTSAAKHLVVVGSRSTEKLLNVFSSRHVQQSMSPVGIAFRERKCLLLLKPLTTTTSTTTKTTTTTVKPKGSFSSVTFWNNFAIINYNKWSLISLL